MSGLTPSLRRVQQTLPAGRGGPRPAATGAGGGTGGGGGSTGPTAPPASAPSLVQSLMRESADGVDVSARLPELKRAILTDGISADDMGMSSHRIYIWLVLLRAPVLAYDDYAALLHRGASPAYAKINDDTHRTLATDPLFARRVSQNSIARLLNTVAWVLDDANRAARAASDSVAPPAESLGAAAAAPAAVEQPLGLDGAAESRIRQATAAESSGAAAEAAPMEPNAQTLADGVAALERHAASETPGVGARAGAEAVVAQATTAVASDAVGASSTTADSALPPVAPTQATSSDPSAMPAPSASTTAASEPITAPAAAAAPTADLAPPASSSTGLPAGASTTTTNPTVPQTAPNTAAPAPTTTAPSTNSTAPPSSSLTAPPTTHIASPTASLSTYVQGMNVLAAPFLYAARSEPQAHTGLVTLLRTQMPAYVTPTLGGVHAGLALVDRLLAQLDPPLFAFLQGRGLGAAVYAFPAVLTLSACTPPLPEVLVLWDFLLAWGVHLNVLAVVAQLHLARQRLLRSESPARELRSLGPLRAARVVELVVAFVGRVDEGLWREVVAHTGGGGDGNVGDEVGGGGGDGHGPDVR